MTAQGEATANHVAEVGDGEGKRQRGVRKRRVRIEWVSLDRTGSVMRERMKYG